MQTLQTISAGKKLAEVVSKRDFGAVIYRQEIEEITGCRWKTSRYYDAVTNANERLTEAGKRIAASGKSGDYQILYPGDYSDAYVKEVKRAKRCVTKGGKILEGAPVNDMTDDERKKYYDVSDFHNRMQAQISGGYVEVRRIAGKKPHPMEAALK